MKRKAMIIGAVLVLAIPLFALADSNDNKTETSELPKVTIDQDGSKEVDNSINEENSSNKETEEGTVKKEQTEEPAVENRENEQFRNNCPYCDEGRMGRGHRHGMMHRNGDSRGMPHCQWREDGERPNERWNHDKQYDSRQQSKVMQRGHQGQHRWDNNKQFKNNQQFRSMHHDERGHQGQHHWGRAN